MQHETAPTKDGQRCLARLRHRADPRPSFDERSERAEGQDEVDRRHAYVNVGMGEVPGEAYTWHQDDRACVHAVLEAPGERKAGLATPEDGAGSDAPAQSGVMPNDEFSGPVGRLAGLAGSGVRLVCAALRWSRHFWGAGGRPPEYRP